MTATSREIRLKSRPQGAPTPDNFELVSVELPPPGPGEVQIRNLWMSVDPYMRGRMNDVRSYIPPFQVGQPLEGGAIGEVTASNDPKFSPGDLVDTMFGWREAFNAPAGVLRKFDAHGLPPEVFLGAAGMPGLTAYVGLTKVAAVKPGDVVFVSAAAGAVGSMVCQIARLKGCTVIGSAGGPDKIAFLDEIGVDRAIDYKAVPDLAKALLDAAPDGVDVYFDNVGAGHLEAALTAARPRARFALCGMIAGYNDPSGAAVRGLMQVITKRLRLEGFIVSDHMGARREFLAEIAPEISAGRIKWRETVERGLDNAPAAFLKLFDGGNIGKMLVKLD